MKNEIQDLIDDIDDIKSSIKVARTDRRKEKLKDKLNREKKKLREFNKKVDISTLDLITPEWFNHILVKKIEKSKRPFKNIIGNIKNLNDLLKELKNDTGKYRIQVLFENKVIRSADVTFPGDKIDIVKLYFLINSKKFIFDIYKNTTIGVSKIKRVKSNVLIQEEFRNNTYGHCLYESIMSSCLSRREKCKQKKKLDILYTFCKKINSYFSDKYAGIEDIQNICNNFSVNITIKDVMGNIMYSFKRPNLEERCLMSFVFINTRDKHLEISCPIKKKIIINSLDDMRNIYDSLNGKFFTYIEDQGRYFKIDTATTQYKYEGEFQEKKKEFYKKNKDCMIPYSDFLPIHNASHFNIKKTEEKLHVIDIKKAYTRFNDHTDYIGFPGKLHKHYTDDFTYEFTQTHLGFYKIINVSQNYYIKLLNIITENTVHSSARLKMFKKLDMSFDIIEGYFSENKPVDIDITGGLPLNYKIDQVPFYSYLAGNFARINDISILGIDTDKVWGEHISGLAEELGYIVHRVEEDKYQIVNILEYKPYNFYHWYIFIIDYMVMHVIDQLKKMNMSKVYRLGIDSIYYKEHNFGYDKNIWQYEGLKNQPLHTSDGYILPHYTKKNDKEYKTLPYTVPEVHIGPGGYGKTHRLINDYGLLDICYVALSYKIVRSNKKVRHCVLSRLIGQGCEMYHSDKPTPSCIIIDECTQISEEQKNKIIKLFPDSLIYFSGDIDKNNVVYQTKYVGKGKGFTVENLNIIDDYTTDWRTSDEKLIKLKNHIRNNIDGPVIKINQTDEYNSYGIGDWFLAYTHRECDIFDKKMIKSDLPIKRYVVQRSSRSSSKGDVFLGKTQPPNSIEQYSTTIHQVQGETIKTGKIFIQQNMINDNRLLYVAVSRAVSFDQLKFL